MSRRMPPSRDDLSFDEPLINLTALIDVIFVLLITFMILAPILNVEHVELAQKGASTKTKAHQAVLSIFIKADDRLVFEGKELSFVELKTCLQKKSYNKEVIPQVLVDQKSHFGLYQNVKNLLEDCGFSEMDLVLK